MNCLRLPPVFFSFLLIAAHFTRAGMTSLAILCLALPSLLIFRRPWSVRILQGALVLAAIEWFRTGLHLVQWRMEMDMDWARLAVVMGAVTLCTASSAAIFSHWELRRKYFPQHDNHHNTKGVQQ